MGCCINLYIRCNHNKVPNSDIRACREAGVTCFSAAWQDSSDIALLEKENPGRVCCNVENLCQFLGRDNFLHYHEITEEEKEEISRWRYDGEYAIYNLPSYEEMKQQGLLVKINSGIDVQMIFHGNNVFMDATNPRTRKYVWEKCKKNYADLGIKTFWLDEAEPEFTTYEYENYRYHAGPVIETGNIYPREYARLFYEGQRESGQDDIVNLIRCAWAGSQRYGALVWSGDIMSTYEDFRKQICAGIHMGLSGIPWWTTDIGGFHGGQIADEGFRELLVRWFQFGAFCPVMRLHGCRQPSTPIINRAGEEREGTGADNEVWSFGEEAYPILVKFIQLRELLRDYTRSLMKQAHENGDPVIRALFYEFPDDKECWDITDSYLFGSDILVAPVCHEKARSRRVYLPSGASWTDARTGQIYSGGQWIDADAPLDTLPVFLRDGRQEYLIGKL